MKRVAVLLMLGAAGWSLSVATVSGFKASGKAPLPNLDRRGEGGAAPFTPAQQAALSRLREREPALEVTLDPLLGAPKFIRSRDGFLTGPNGQGRTVAAGAAQALPAGDPHLAVKAFLNDHAGLFGHGAEVIAAARVKREYVTAHNGLRTVVWEQHLGGVGVFDTVLVGHITAQGELVSLSSQFLPDLNQAANAAMPNRAAVLADPPISAAQAVVLAAANLGAAVAAAELLPAEAAPAGADRHQRFTGGAGLSGRTEVRLTWLPLGRGGARLAWDVVLSSKARGEMFRLVVDAERGDVIVRRGLTEYISDASYRVYTSDSPSPFSPGHPTPLNGQPPVVPRTLVVTSAVSVVASPNGWINDGDNETLGNNVDAHLDRDNDDQPDLPRPQGSPTRVFDFPLDLTQEPTTYGNAAVVNLFYWNNWIHDRLYELGFTEAAGNFQTLNFNRGGQEGDAVEADAQDGGGFNNANFSTPQDGSPGRMQMYLFNGPNPDRDGDLDAEVIIHEYVHGLSNRRVGGGVGISALQPRGMGEGWSDFYGIALLSEPGDDVNGNYGVGGYLTFQLGTIAANYYFGIRRYPYTTDLTKNPLTFKDIDDSQASAHAGIPVSGGGPANEVHNQGEVWCVTLWEARANLIAKHGFTNGNRLILQLVTDGMGLSPVNPNFLESRDAIILADQVNNAGANYNELWRAFAKRGMGGSATSPDSFTTQGVEEAFDLPGLALRGQTINDFSTGNGNGVVDNNECVELNLVLVNLGLLTARNITATLVTTTPGVTVTQPGSTYPDVVRNGTATNNAPFRFYTSPTFVCGTAIEFSLRIVSDQGPRTNRVIVPTGLIGPATRFDNNTMLNIPDGSFFSVESPIAVSNFFSTLGKVTVSLHIQHQFDFDLIIQLVSPDGTIVELSALNGFNGQNFGRACAPDTERTTFDDKAATAIGAGTPPYVGTFRPDQPLAAFNGKTGNAVNGNWRLRIRDVFFGDTGSLQCWSLNLSPTLCSEGTGECPTDLAVSMTGSPAIATTGSNLVYAVTVTNQGPNGVRQAQLVDTLPAGVAFVSANSTRGSCALAGGRVTCTFNNLTNRASATAFITVRPLVEGSLTNTATVTSTALDLVATNNTATLVTPARAPVPVIVAAGATLVAESLAPPNGGIDIGEMVTLTLVLQNFGGQSTANLVATLLATNGVTAPDGPQSYGALLAGGGPAVGRNFSFTAAGTNGGSIGITLRLTEGTNNLGLVEFRYGLASTFTVMNPTVLNIRDLTNAAPYPSPLFVNNVFGRISRVSVTFSNLSHGYPADIDALLVSPAGQKVMLMSDAGGFGNVNVPRVSFDDLAAGLVPSGSLPTGTYKPTDYQPGDFLPAPAPAGPYATNLSRFVGASPNGTWNLYVVDDDLAEAGRLSSGWSLTFYTIDPVNPESDLGVALAGPATAVNVGTNVTYTITVTNNGRDTASSVVVSNGLPAGLSFVSAVSPVGGCSVAGGSVVCNLGSLTNGASVNILLTATAVGSGTLTVTAAVSSSAVDFYSLNNAAAISTTVNPAADLAVTLSAPAQSFVANPFLYSLLVTNQGPNTAGGIVLTNTIPTNTTFVSAVPSQGSCSQTNGIVTCNLGTLANRGAATVALTVTTPAAVGVLSNRVAVGAIGPRDPATANNQASLITSNINPAFVIMAAGASLVGEGNSPANGGIDVGESVTVSLGLRNVGTASTTNLVATLVTNAAVGGAGGAQNYGVVISNGPAVSRSFTFNAGGLGGAMLTVSLQLQEGSIQIGTVSFQFTLGGERTYVNSQPVNIPDNGMATPYPSIIGVAGVSGLVTRVGITLSKLQHSFPQDLDVLLVGPSGQSMLALSDAAGTTPVSGLTMILDDTAAALVPEGVAPASGAYRPSNYGAGDAFPSPAPGGPYGTVFSVFEGTSPNGGWQLYVLDDNAGDPGRIEGGWRLHLTTVGTVSAAAARLSHPRLGPGGQFEFTLLGQTGETYVIEASSDFAGWSPLTTNTLSSSSFIFQDVVGSGRRFYRAVRP